MVEASIAFIQQTQDILGLGGGERIPEPVIENKQIDAGQLPPADIFPTVLFET